ncbi:MAG: 2-C-methyl-D-erythritol 4-phosphate cytidylyltransferase [Lachnospiraceae bacterium]|nr:2-C-methyl-D-erythritol 4-phosphate cytidylyltransferase [Lachnospiraceae bacterium]
MSAVKPKYTAIVMAAGSGVRMKTETRKQFLNLLGMPVVAYSLRAFQQNDNISSIVLVVPKGFVDEAMAMCIRYGFNKVRNIAEGSDKRFKSVYRGLQAAPPDTDYVLIHDGVRPMLTGELIDRCCKFVLMTRACVAAVPVTDTIKRANIHGFAVETLDRSTLWSIQTPQAFSYPLLLEAYRSLQKTIEEYGTDESKITDDAVIVENMTDCHVRIVAGDSRNIKITTPSDMIVAEAYLRSMEEAN